MPLMQCPLNLRCRSYFEDVSLKTGVQISAFWLALSFWVVSTNWKKNILFYFPGWIRKTEINFIFCLDIWRLSIDCIRMYHSEIRRYILNDSGYSSKSYLETEYCCYFCQWFKWGWGENMVLAFSKMLQLWQKINKWGHT